ncbi:MAG TPA: glycosyltransferase family 4 protein, partial [Candidatus Sulfopaludibacter sp.]|nr:glycosyltransferase family 4 protein [Candidatus Sulfopaludibacter sp.]
FTSIPLILIVKPDIIVISVPPGETAFGSIVIAKILKKNVVIDYRDEWEDHLIGVIKSTISKKAYILLKKIMSNCYRTSKTIIAVTRPLSNSLLLRNIKNVKIIPNGADCNYFRPFNEEKERIQFRISLGFNKDDFILVYSGGIGGYYRIDIVIKALEKVILKIPTIKLLIIGYGLANNVEEIISLSKELKIYDNILFLNSKTEDLANLLSCCNIGIVPYDANLLWKNSLPVKSFEYFACGLPVIATVYKDSVLGKMIEENKIGLISEPEDIDGLADAIEKIFNSDLSSPSKRAVSFVRKHYDRNNTAKEFIELLETVAKS